MNTPGPKTILVCDDEEHLRELIRLTLGPSHRYVDAVDGVEALELARRVEPDLVLLDLMLPRRSGQEVLEDLRRDPAVRDTPIVVISAWSHAVDTAMAAGADRFVAKPFEPDELRVIVDELLAER